MNTTTSVEARRTGASARRTRAVRRHRHLAGLALVGLLGTIGASIAAAQTLPNNRPERARARAVQLGNSRYNTPDRASTAPGGTEREESTAPPHNSTGAPATEQPDNPEPQTLPGNDNGYGCNACDPGDNYGETGDSQNAGNPGAYDG